MTTNKKLVEHMRGMTTVCTWPAATLPTFEQLRAVVRFERIKFMMYGKECTQPRGVAWLGAVPYKYSGQTLPAFTKGAAWPSLISRLCKRASIESGVLFNSVLCNLYEDGSNSVTWHSDDEPLFGSDPVIASLSLGATRRFKMRKGRSPRTATAVREFNLTHGSFLVMGAGVQNDWQHCVPKTRKLVGPRINLTFRRVVMTD